MRSYIKMTLLMAIAVMTLLAARGVSYAQGVKMGFIDDEKIKTEFKDWQRAQDQWEIEKNAWNEEADAKQTELQEMIDEYDKQKLILSEEKKQEREAAIRTKRDALDAFTRQVYGPGGTAEKKQSELIEPLLAKINKAIEAVAIDNDYDVIFTMQSGLGYIRETYDITDKVLEQLEKIEE